MDARPETPRSTEPDDLPTPEGSHRRRPAVHRRGLKRSSAACQRCRKRKQKCDGRIPVCGPCSSVGASCVPSDRLVIRVDSDCDCDRLRARVRELEEENQRLGAQPPLASRDPVARAVHGVCNSRILTPTFPRLVPDEAQQPGLLSSAWRLWDGLTANNAHQTPEAFTATLLEAERLELVDVFFTRRWPQYPVVHKPTFMEQHYGPFSRGEVLSAMSSFLVNMVLAIGASEKEGSTPSCRALHQSFFQDAVGNLDDVLGSDDLETIQCLLLLCIYGSNEPQCLDLWYTAGLALRLATGMNLHRRESVGSRGLLEDEMSKRLFWSVYALDRSICIAMGRPLGIQDADITTPLPLCLTDDMLVAQTGAENISLASLVPQARDMSTFLHIIQLRRINADIYRMLHSAGETSLTPDGLETMRSQYYGQLNQWLVSAPRYISPACMNQTPEWFQIAFHQAVMNLYRPSHASPLGTVSLDAIRLCADSAISLISSYGALYAKNRITYSFVALTSLFMAAVTMLYSLRASAVLRTELTRDVVESNIRVCSTLLKNVANGRAVGERSASIIQRLGTATLAIFDSGQDLEGGIDREFMSWFGLKSQHSDLGQTTPSMDMPWNDLFDNGFDFGGLFCSDMLLP